MRISSSNFFFSSTAKSVPALPTGSTPSDNPLVMPPTPRLALSSRVCERSSPKPCTTPFLRFSALVFVGPTPSSSDLFIIRSASSAALLYSGGIFSNAAVCTLVSSPSLSSVGVLPCSIISTADLSASSNVPLNAGCITPSLVRTPEMSPCVFSSVTPLSSSDFSATAVLVASYPVLRAFSSSS